MDAEPAPAPFPTDVVHIAHGMTVTSRDRAVVLAVHGRVDHRRLHDLQRALVWAVRARADIAVELADDVMLGAGGISLLVRAARASATRGRHLRVVELAGATRR